jgi:hypothetical protein
MNTTSLRQWAFIAAVVLSTSTRLVAQPDDFGPPDGMPPMDFEGDFRPPMGPGGPMQQEQKIVSQFDKDGDKRLSAAERKAAREFLAKQTTNHPQRFGPRPGGFGGPNEAQTPATPGAKLALSDVKQFNVEPLYDTATLNCFTSDRASFAPGVAGV